jgi:iron-sulfur cluster assembly accessory protein
VPATEEEYNIKGSPEEDEFFDLGNNKKLVLDSVSQMYLIGSTIDYKSDFISSQLTVINPMAKSSCGCGTSIAV